MMTIDGMFRDTVRRYPDSVALRYYHDETWEFITYTELNSAVNTIAHGLYDLGIQHDSKIAIMCENRPEWVVSYLAIITTGALAVPIDAVLGEEETAHILKHSETNAIICSMKSYDVISRILSEIDTLNTIIILERNIIVRHDHRPDGRGKALVDKDRKRNHHKNFLSYDELREHGISRLDQGNVMFYENSVEDIASILYTSGTTGSPKGVMLTHTNIMSNVESTKSVINVLKSDNFLLLLPLHHTFPFTTCFCLPVSEGAAISFVDILARDRTRLIMECQPTIMLGVPLLYSKILRGIMRQIELSKLKSLLFKYGGKKIIGIGLKKKLGGKLRLMVSGAAPMDPEVIQSFVSLGIEFIEGYGLTETSPVVSCNLLGKIKIGSVGPALKGVQVRIVEPDRDGIGEIMVRGDNVMLGYYKNPGQTAKVIENGWFHTGDLGKIDEDGYIFITGRAKDVIVTRGGKNVYPDVVENVINKSKYIAESIVLGYRTKGMVGEDVGVLIYPDYEALSERAKGENVTFTEAIDIEQLTIDAKDEMVQHFRTLLEQEVKMRMDQLAPYQRPTRISIERDEFTKTSTRKIKRFLYNGRLDILDIS
jgi:long-chain acyl-CoA synthetase